VFLQWVDGKGVGVLGWCVGGCGACSVGLWCGLEDKVDPIAIIIMF
jgi:hypothetical protein